MFNKLKELSISERKREDNVSTKAYDENVVERWSTRIFLYA